jgi:hypothetical protein
MIETEQDKQVKAFANDLRLSFENGRFDIEAVILKHAELLNGMELIGNDLDGSPKYAGWTSEGEDVFITVRADYVLFGINR